MTGTFRSTARRLTHGEEIRLEKHLTQLQQEFNFIYAVFVGVSLTEREQLRVISTGEDAGRVAELLSLAAESMQHVSQLEEARPAEKPS